MRLFRFRSAVFLKEDGREFSSSSILYFETFDEAVKFLSSGNVIAQEDLKSAFIPVCFEEIGKISGKVREK